MGVILDVPYCNQLAFPGQSNPGNDPTGCWYASACMLGWFFEAGPRLGVPELHTTSLPVEVQNRLGFQGHFATGSPDARRVMNELHGGQSEHDLLARREHLAAIAHCARPDYNFGGDQMETLLRRHGPVFFYWWKTVGGQSYGHASVVTGLSAANRVVHYHDPENAPNSTMTLTDFNAVRQRWRYAMMRKEGPHPSINARWVV